MYNIALIEDDQGIRKTLSDFFSASERVNCVMAVDDIEKFLKFHRDFLEIKLVLLDVMLHNQSSIYDIPKILQREPETEIIMFTVIDDSNTIFQALTYGATGYVLKDISHTELEEKIIMVLEGRGALISPAIARKIVQHFRPESPNLLDSKPVVLSEKEVIVTNLLREGRTYDEIAERLGISLNGVRYYVKSIYRKLQVNSKGELLRKLKA